MNRILGLILFLFTFTATAADPCRVFEVQGEVLAHKDHFELRIAPGTRSEIKFKLPIILQSKVFPYVDQFVKATLVIKEKELSHSSNLIDIKSIQRSVPDPMNAGDETYKKYVGESKCH